MFLRALRLRCPHCGGGPVFLSWRRLVPSCPVCGLGFERGEQGYWLGAYFFNLMAVETVFGVWIMGVLWWTWPAPPWDLVQAGSVVLMLVAPFALFPWSKTLFLAFDLLVRPPEAEDFTAPREASPRVRGRRSGT